MKVLCIVSIVINLLLASMLLLSMPQSKQPSQPARDIDIVKVSEYHYTSGPIKLRESLDANDKVVRSEWILPDGRLLARTVWRHHVNDSYRGWAFFLDDSGAIKAMFDGRDGTAHGTWFTFDPPVMPSTVRVYDEGQIVDEYDPGLALPSAP
jgi:hypothetical protein